MQSRITLYALASILCVIGIGLTLYKHFNLGFPLLPNDHESVWTIEATIEYEALGEPVIVSFALPTNPPGVQILGEEFASSGYGFSEFNEPDGRRGEWSKRSAEGSQAVYYRLEVFGNPAVSGDREEGHPKPPQDPEFEEPYATAAKTLLGEIEEASANDETFTRGLIQTLNSANEAQNLRLLRGLERGAYDRADLLVDLLSMQGINARMVRGLYLEDGRRRQSLSHYLEVYTGSRWVFFDQYSATIGIPENVLFWQRGGQSMLEVEGGKGSRALFSIIENRRSTRGLAVRYGQNNKAALVDFSIYSLPVAEQNVFKSILLIPIGALIVIFMRIVIGIRTSGTFMPILIALAFIQTTLLTGLFIFLLVVGVGLVIRSFLSKLDLLLVARISAVIIVVVFIVSAISIISHKIGFNQALTVTFFPMIILAWTIERMSVLWEEEGPHEVLIQGGGSLLVAVIAYMFMTNRVIEYLTFNFPELLLVLLALILLLGQYSGYRLSELRRFRALAPKKSIDADKP